MNFDLRNILTEEDKLKIKNYLWMYGVHRDVDVELWLQDWAENNETLYHLLGDNLIYKIPYHCEMSEQIIEKRMNHFCVNSTLLDAIYGYFCFKDYREMKDTSSIPKEIEHFVRRLMLAKNFANNKLSDYPFPLGMKNLKYKDEKTGKTLSFQVGMKTIKAIRLLVDFILTRDPAFAEERGVTMQAFEEFRIQHSMILNDVKIVGNLCFSIHPLDYMTMSDNDANWTSCMNWRKSGCYHTGTVEMMNSENVVCCYLESTNSNFNFYSEKNKNKNIKKEDCEWNNKKWRILAIVTKDIIASIKGYPYQNEAAAKDIVLELEKMAETNLNWTYEAGLAEYDDMKEMTPYDIEFFEDCDFDTCPEEGIIFRTNGMYNDMAHDNQTNYYCVRNSVGERKRIDISGSCHCAICQRQVLTMFEDWEYNEEEKYDNTDTILCEWCRSDYKCPHCGEYYEYETPNRGKIISFSLKNPETGEIRQARLCSDCAAGFFSSCPECGKDIFWIDGMTRPSLISCDSFDLSNYTFSRRVYNYRSNSGNPYLLHLCYDCLCKNKEHFVKRYYKYGQLRPEEEEDKVYVLVHEYGEAFPKEKWREPPQQAVVKPCDGGVYELSGNALNLFDSVDWEENFDEV